MLPCWRCEVALMSMFAGVIVSDQTDRNAPFRRP